MSTATTRATAAAAAAAAAASSNDANQEDLIDSVHDTLSAWGFTENHCERCGKLNSQLDGLLMQCGKCKKAYYCSSVCFNADLPRHQAFCRTQHIHRDPHRAQYQHLVSSSSARTATKEKIDYAARNRQRYAASNNNDTSSSSSSSAAGDHNHESSSESSAGSDAESDNASDTTPPALDDWEESEPASLNCPKEKEDEDRDNVKRRLQLGTGNLPESPVWERETVHLRHTDTTRQHDMERNSQPLWANAALRKTAIAQCAREYDAASGSDSSDSSLLLPKQGNEKEVNLPENTLLLNQGRSCDSPESKEQHRNIKVIEGNLDEQERQQREQVRLRHADVGGKRDIAWEKPAWATAAFLRKTGQRPSQVDDKALTACSHQLRPLHGDVPDVEGSAPPNESVHLRRAERRSKQYEWAKPEWATGARLRKTGKSTANERVTEDAAIVGADVVSRTDNVSIASTTGNRDMTAKATAAHPGSSTWRSKGAVNAKAFIPPDHKVTAPPSTINEEDAAPEQETVALRETAVLKGDIQHSQPEWVNRKLRPTGLLPTKG